MNLISNFYMDYSWTLLFFLNVKSKTLPVSNFSKIIFDLKICISWESYTTFMKYENISLHIYCFLTYVWARYSPTIKLYKAFYFILVDVNIIIVKHKSKCFVLFWYYSSELLITHGLTEKVKIVYPGNKLYWTYNCNDLKIFKIGSFNVGYLNC